MTSYIEKKPTYRIDLSKEHAIAQRNYGRLLRVFPAWRDCDEVQFYVRGCLTTFKVQSRDRYSSVFSLSRDAAKGSLLGPVQCRLRVYHDVQMVDITEWNGSRRFRARYDYPNAAMFAKDEKWQLNRFLGEWLDDCLKDGLSNQELPIPGSGTTG